MRPRPILCLAVVIGLLAVLPSARAQAQPAEPQDSESEPAMPQDVPPQFTHPQGAPAARPAPAIAPPNVQQPAPAAAPETGGDTGKTMVGAWEFSNADHDRICHFNFRSDAMTGGFKLDIDANCPNLFPSTANIVGWSLNNYGDLNLIDGEGKPVIELTQVEGGMYDGFTPEEGRYILQSAAAAPTVSAADIAGDWAVTRGAGRPICLLTLTTRPAGDALALTVKPGCDPFVLRFGPTAWRVDEGSLVLLSAHGQNWQFEANDAKTWQRVPDIADPILLVKQ